MNGVDYINTILSVTYKIKMKAMRESFPFLIVGEKKHVV